jgi:predicted nuclease with TOPRIM domain
VDGFAKKCIHIEARAKMENPTLQSWKEIARYLNRGVRTVQRWEHFGLPVHRPAGHDRSAVFALKQEVDAWLVRSGTSHAKETITGLEEEVSQLRAECARLKARLDELEAGKPALVRDGNGAQAHTNAFRERRKEPRLVSRTA